MRHEPGLPRLCHGTPRSERAAILPLLAFVAFLGALRLA